MEALGEQLKAYGIAGVLMAVIIAAASILLRKVLEARESDLKWSRDELLAGREAFLSALKEIAATFQTSLRRLESSFTVFNSRICERLEKIEERLAGRSVPERRRRPDAAEGSSDMVDGD